MRREGGTGCVEQRSWAAHSVPRSPPLELRTGTHRPHPTLCEWKLRSRQRPLLRRRRVLPVISRLCDLVEGVGAGWRGKKIRRHLNLLSVRGNSGVARWGQRERAGTQTEIFCIAPFLQELKSLLESTMKRNCKKCKIVETKIRAACSFPLPSCPECPTYFSSCPKVNKQFWSSCD